jgi:CubicO group peptidase (beta-lactamase class C family)
MVKMNCGAIPRKYRPHVLERVGAWDVGRVAAGVVTAAKGVVETWGDASSPFALASVTKLLTATACLVAVEEGTVGLDDAAGPAGSTVRHLLAHASGLAFDTDQVLTRPGHRRIYSNTGFEVLGDVVSAAAGMPFATYLREAVLEPLGMRATSLDGSPAADATSTVDDLLTFTATLLRPGRILAPPTIADATRVQFPGLDGVLPGFGRQSPNDWGLGFELKDGKSPHWTAPDGSPRTYGHFGRAGTFVWVDPDAAVACVVLTDRPFGAWATEAWPALSSAVLDAYA